MGEGLSAPWSRGAGSQGAGGRQEANCRCAQTAFSDANQSVDGAQDPFRAGLVEKARHKPVKNPTKPRFFERSRPNQLWQSDIMTLRLVGRNAFNFLAAKGHLERGSSV